MTGSAVTWVARRLLHALLTLVGITIVTFLLIHAVPGDPVSFYVARVGPRATPAAIEAIRREHHLDRPLPWQYARWVAMVVRLDFGRSTIDSTPVRERILNRLPATIALNLGAFLLAALLGVPLGIWSATRAGSRSERAVAVALFLLYSLPTFWIALLLMEWLSIRLGLFPLFGMGSYDHESMAPLARLADRVRHLALPVLSLAVVQTAIFARYTSSALAEVLTQDFITTARAKGAGEGEVLLSHALRNALLPLVTLVGMIVPALISGSVIVETIFQWDGIGRLYFESILARDYPTVLGLTVATALVTLLATLLTDFLYAVIDPRIRLERGAA